MHAQLYRYSPPKLRLDDFLDLQRRVAAAYSRVGCKQSLLLRSTTTGEDWVDISIFESNVHAREAEQYLESNGTIAQLFSEFLAITGLTPEQIRQEQYDVVMNKV